MIKSTASTSEANIVLCCSKLCLLSMCRLLSTQRSADDVIETRILDMHESSSELPKTQEPCNINSLGSFIFFFLRHRKSLGQDAAQLSTGILVVGIG